MERNAAMLAESLGFKLEGTGGGFTALMREEGKGPEGPHIMITSRQEGQEDGYAPEALSEPVLVGFYREYGDEGVFANFESLSDALWFIDSMDRGGFAK